MRAMRKSNRSFARVVGALIVVLAAAAGTALTLGACAASSARAEKAKSSYYQTDYPVIWNAVIEAVKAEGYDRIKVEDAVNGRLETDWHKVERVADSQATDPNSRGGMDTSGAIFFRVKVQIEGKKPPYKVWIDGEAARYRPGYSSLFPLKHGEEDEPHWVPGRINAVYVRVLDRLEQYAIAPTDAQLNQAAPANDAPAEEEPAPVDAPPVDAPPGEAPAAPAPAPAPAP